MASLQLQLLNANRRALVDTLDVHIVEVQTNRTVAVRRGVSGKKKLTVLGLNANAPHLVRVFPSRHRPVGAFTLTPGGEKPRVLQFYCPIHPDRVIDPKFPEYAQLPRALSTILEASTLEGPTPALSVAGETPGQALYDHLTPTQRAGLLNIYCKMDQTALGERTAWSCVTSIYRVRGDRIFVHVTTDFRDRVKSAVAGGRFKQVDGSLHTPPANFAAAGSFKSEERYGNLQLTFFSTIEGPLGFIVDADIDDAGGIEHAFQVLEHWITRGATHPYDIHQILTFHQSLSVPYDLVV